MKPIWKLPLFFVALLLFPLIAFAQVAVVPDLLNDPGAFLKLVYESAASKQWALLIPLVIIALVSVLRKYGAKFVPFIATDRGGVITAFVAAFVTTLAAQQLSGAAFNLDLVFAGISSAFLAIGGYVGVRKFFFPVDMGEPSPAEAGE